jgi:hypothetical protein
VAPTVRRLRAQDSQQARLVEQAEREHHLGSDGREVVPLPVGVVVEIDSAEGPVLIAVRAAKPTAAR